MPEPFFLRDPVGIIVIIGIMEYIYWGYIGIMENKMETTIMGLGFRVWGLGLRVEG